MSLPTAPEPHDGAAVHHFTAAVEPAQRPRGRRVLVWAGSLLAAAAFGLVHGPSLHQVVLRRRSDGAEILRLNVDDGTEADSLMEEVQEDLARLTVEEFSLEWNLPTPA